MNISLRLIIIIFIFLSCEKSHKSENIVVLYNQTKNQSFWKSGMGSWKPNHSEINTLVNLIPEVIKKNKAEFYIDENNINFDDYYFQFIPYINEDNRKIIYVNSLCKSYFTNSISNLNETLKKNTNNNWKTDFIEFYDGWNCSWRFKFDFESNEYFGFEVY